MSGKKNTYYFPHDCNARSDEKLLAVRMRHKVEGYGIYFMLVEMLAEQPDHTLRRDYDMIAFELRADSEKVRSVVEDFGLFEFSADGRFFSLSLNERMKTLDNIRQQRSLAGKKSAERRATTNDAATKVQKNTTTVELSLDFGATTDGEKSNKGDRREEIEEIEKIEEIEGGCACARERSLEEEKNGEADTSCGGAAEEKKEIPGGGVELPNRVSGEGYVTVGRSAVGGVELRDDDDDDGDGVYEVLLDGIVTFYDRMGMRYTPDYRYETTSARELRGKIGGVMKADKWIVSTDSIKTWWNQFLVSAWRVADKWQREHFDMKNINSQFNSIYNKVKQNRNGNRTSINGGRAIDNPEFLASIAQTLYTGAAQ